MMKPYLKTRDHAVTGEEFDLVLKGEVDMLYTSPTPDNMEPYYDSDSYISHTDANVTFSDKLYQWVKFKALRLIQSPLK